MPLGAPRRIFPRMARKKKRPELKHCKVTSTNHPKAPWRVSYPVEREGRSVRIRQSFAKEDSAWTFAEKKEKEVENHGVRFGDIPPEVRRVFDFYRDEAVALAEIGASVPRFEDLVTGALAEVRRRHAELAKKSVPVAEAVAGLVAFHEEKIGRMEARLKRRKERHQRDRRTRLKRFAQDFGDRPLATITSAEIEAWLHALRSRRNPDKLAEPPLLGPLSRNHYRAHLHALFAYGVAAARGWCEANPVAAIEPEEVEAGEPESYAPEDAARIMHAALETRPELVPVLALQFFAGLRVSEARGIELSKLPLDDESEDQFRVADSKTGTRQAPFTPACRAWLAAQAARKGPAWRNGEADFYDALKAVHAVAGVEPIDNGARHSFISYRCAETRDVAAVADECGNSVGTIKAHYRTATTAKAAAKFFAIRPATMREKSKITNIEKGRASA